MTHFERAVNFVLKREGTVSDHPADRGGFTVYGIIKNDLEWAAKHIKGWNTATTLATLTLDQAKEIYYHRYWLGSRANKMAPGFAEVVFDIAVNNGHGAAAKLLQRAIGVEVDGKIGPITINKTFKCGSTELRKLLDLRQEYYNCIVANNASQKVFLKGWTNRNEALRKFVML